MPGWTDRQMMTIALARQIQDGMTCVIGTGLPLMGASLAKNTTAPNAKLIFESGMMDGGPIEMPTSVSDLRVAYHASALLPQFRYFGFRCNAWKKKKIDLGILGGAQIDPYGNINSTSIGDYWHPKTRFGGSGGANGIANQMNTIIIMNHERRRFCQKVDYLTSVGWGDGPDGRKKLGLLEVGPQAVITELGIMRFDAASRRMYLAEYFPGKSVDRILENTGFELDVSRAVESEAPSDEIMAVLNRIA